MKMQRPFTQLPPFCMQHCIGVWHVGAGETHSFDWQTRPAPQPPQLMVPPQPFATVPHTPDEQEVRGTHAVVVNCTVDVLTGVTSRVCASAAPALAMLNCSQARRDGRNRAWS